jgi:hypothetical protein
VQRKRLVCVYVKQTVSLLWRGKTQADSKEASSAALAN